MALEKWAAYVDGIRQSIEVDIEVIGDFIEPCPHCGVPCAGIYRFWYEEANKLMMVEVDQLTFDGLMDESLNKAFSENSYHSMPAFVRSYHEWAHWGDTNANYAGTVIDKSDFKKMVIAMQQFPNNSVRVQKLLVTLLDLADKALLKNKELLALDD